MVRMLLLALREGVEASRRRPWELDFWSGIGSEIGMLFVRSYGGFSYVGRFGEGGGTLYIECAYPGAGISSSNSGCGSRCWGTELWLCLCEKRFDFPDFFEWIEHDRDACTSAALLQQKINDLEQKRH